MEKKELFPNGTILVCISDQKTGCGILYVRRGSIVKAAHPEKQYSSWTEVYRNRGEEATGRRVDMYCKNYRVATYEESLMWSDGVYHTAEAQNTNAVTP